MNQKQHLDCWMQMMKKIRLAILFLAITSLLGRLAVAHTHGSQQHGLSIHTDSIRNLGARFPPEGFFNQSDFNIIIRHDSFHSPAAAPPALLAWKEAQHNQAGVDNEDKRRARQALLRVLTDGDLPALGPVSAPVTMVIFSDFECPFCRKLAMILSQQILPLEGQQVRVVYRYFPLASHPWAMTAAEEAGCAARQGNNEFWALHNKIFEYQKTINEENVKTRIMDLARSLPGINFAAFQGCVEKQESLKTVLRDVSLGNMAGIYATPTLFVNGWRLDGVGNADELKKIVAFALEDAHEHPANPESNTKAGSGSK
jgi:protein-disulfide isomerase